MRLLVLDEADEMLSMGFLEEINAILDALPKERQTMLFSATIPGEIERLSERYLKDPKRLYLSEDFVGVREIDHVYYMVTGGDRPADLMKVLEYENPELALIFCNTRDDTARVAEFLDAKGFPTEGISSDLTQSDRERVMKRMRAGELRYLCATDIAARGIDIADLSHVINYSFPESADVYVHRTGRTGRAGRSGVAISLVSPREIGSFYYLKLIHKIYPEERHLPTSEEMTTRREGELHKTLVERYLGKPAQQLHLDLLKRVWSTADGARLLALALEEILEKPKVVRQAPVSRPPRRNERRDEERDEREDRDERPRRGGRERDRGGRRERGRSRDRGGRDRDRGRGGRDRDRGGRGRDSDHDDRRDRKRTRTRRNGESEGSASDESMPDNVEAFTTTDGDVELYETIEVGAETSTGDRGNEKRSRRRERRSEDEESQPGMARLYLNVGRRHNIHAEDIASFFQISGELSAEQIGNVTQRDRHSYINIAEDAADSAIERLAGKEISGRSVRIEHAKPRS
ncbi:MAG: hypothetical protein CSB49_06890 [Proteobacteria bacterium]|nr:MAG: hypothetical protein CSB49_06890 [Pseudomonadota bacterium]